jgi:hypothetical protein
MTETNCNECRFWDELGATSDVGECRRHAPHPVPRTNGLDLHHEVSFPITSFLHWCGEHQPTPPAETRRAQA